MCALRSCSGKLRRAPGNTPPGGIPLMLVSDLDVARQRYIQMPFSPNTSFLEEVPLLREVRGRSEHANASIFLAEHFAKVRRSREVVRVF